MTSDLERLLRWNRPIGRFAWLCAGVVFMAAKFSVDWSIAHFLFARSWSPTNYLFWPDPNLVRIFDLPADDRSFAFTLLLVSLQFVVVGVVLTARRLYAAGLPLGLVSLFFVPWVNLLFFVILAVAPTRADAAPDPSSSAARESRVERARLAEIGRAAALRGFLAAGAAGVLVALAMIGVGVVLFEHYGFGLFVGAPFSLGLVAVLVAGRARPLSPGESFWLTMSTLLAAGVALFLFAAEGVMCLVMAVPLAFPLAIFGAAVGYAIHRRAWSRRETQTLLLVLALVSPALMSMEATVASAPPLRAVATDVVIDAPPEVVWKSVVAFPPIDEPPSWLFRAGIACPLRAEIDGEGVGAVRHCVFTTGDFVEPIDVWDPPRMLRFDVTGQPPPMREWSPYEIHPPHLDGFLVSRKGQFRLESLADGRTRLEGTTWYTNRMWPQDYWAIWSDALIHAIHRRVLDHIRRVAEATTRGGPR